MNPKPLAVLKNFTVPFGMISLLSESSQQNSLLAEVREAELYGHRARKHPFRSDAVIEETNASSTLQESHAQPPSTSRSVSHPASKMRALPFQKP
jgi:hypothetical protein